MRFMVLVPASEESEAGILPNEALLTKMGRFNEEMVKAGVMLAGGIARKRTRSSSSKLNRLIN